MAKGEFLEELRLALQGNISQIEVNEHLQYYERYIIEESRKGRTEEDVLQELGNPRLIARTIIDTSEQSGNTYDETYDENGAGEPKRRSGFHIDYTVEKGWNIGYGRFKFNSWYGILLAILLFLIILIVIGNVVIFLLPVIGVMILIGLLISLIMGRKG